jgi:hypothetical protein
MLPAMPLRDALDTTRFPRVAGRPGDQPAWLIASLPSV